MSLFKTSRLKIPGQFLPEQLPPFVSSLQPRSKPKLPPLPPEKRIGFAIVGLGRLSLEQILPAFNDCQLAKVTALMTGDIEKGRRVAKEYGLNEAAVYNYDEWEKLQQDPLVQAVYIVTPNGLHKEMTLQAAQCKKHVLCEKPMANSSKEAREMIAACKKAKVKLMIAYRCHYEPHHQAVLDIVKQGKLGSLISIEAHNGQDQASVKQWRHSKKLAGGGALPDIGIYCLNFARYVTGEEPDEVNAWMWSPIKDARFKEVESNVAWQMHFPSGIVALLNTSYNSYESRSARLYFEKGTVEFNPAFSYAGLRIKITHRDPRHEEVNIQEERILPPENQFMLEIDHMAECILTNKEPATPGEEGLKDHLIMEAIYQSAKKKHSVALSRLF